MSNDRVLMIANSVYQLMTAVHIRQNLLPECQVDLIVTDITPSLSGCAERIRQTSLFHRVIYAVIGETNRKIGGGEEELSAVFRDIPQWLQWSLSEELDDYSQIYFSNYDLFIRMLACRYYHSPCEFLCYEDGFSSYVIDFLRSDRALVNRHAEGRKIKDKVKRVLLYEPRLAMRRDGLPNCAIPKIDPDDRKLRERLNYIFDYRRPDWCADFLFLEQSFRAEKIKTNDLELMEECRQTVGSARFAVKPHPRNPENLPLQRGLTRKIAGDAPWELFLLNEQPREITVITVCSNAALSSRLLFGMDIHTVMLYRLFQGKVLWKEDDRLAQYLRRFRRQFAGKQYYVPETVYELRSILGYLGGQNEG